MHTELLMWTTEIPRRCITSSSTEVAEHSLGVSRSRSQLLFFFKSGISGHSSSSSRHIVSETTSGAFQHPAETSNSNWRGQPELYQFVQKTKNAQQEQTYCDKNSLHLWQDERWQYFNSFHSYWQNGSRHLHRPTRSKSGSIQSNFYGNRLYAISSSLSGGVRISIKL